MKRISAHGEKKLKLRRASTATKVSQPTDEASQAQGTVQQQPDKTQDDGDVVDGEH